MSGWPWGEFSVGVLTAQVRQPFSYTLDTTCSAHCRCHGSHSEPMCCGPGIVTVRTRCASSSERHCNNPCEGTGAAPWGYLGRWRGQLWGKAGERQAKRERKEGKTALKTSPQQVGFNMCIYVQIHMAQPGIKQELTRKLQWSKTDGNYKRPNCKQRQALLSWVMWGVTEVKWMTVIYAHVRGNLSSACPKGERNLLQPRSKIPGIKVYAYTWICPYIIPTCKFSHTEAFTHNCARMDVCLYVSICKCVCLRKFHYTRSESHRY